MNYVVIDVPLWSVTFWDKKFNGVDKEWQPKTIKYKYLLSDELDRINKGGTVRLLYTGQDIGYTTEEMAGDAICEGEIVSIPWGGTPSVKYYKGKFVTGDNRIATSSKPDELLNKYLFYYLKGHLRELASYYRGAGLKHPAMRDVLKMNISYPSATEQRNIIEQFDSLEKVIKVREAQLQKLDELIKARFVEMFGNPISNPKGWATPLIEDVVAKEKNALKAGPFGSALKKEYYVNSGYKIYGQEQVIREDPSFGDYYISEEKFKQLENCAVQAGDVLISLVGTYGKLLIMPEQFQPGIINPRLMKITFDRTKVNPYYFKYYFQSEALKMALADNTHGGTMDILNLGIVRKLKMPLPPLKLQNDFNVFIKQVDKSKVVNIFCVA